MGYMRVSDDAFKFLSNNSYFNLYSKHVCWNSYATISGLTKEVYSSLIKQNSE